MTTNLAVVGETTRRLCTFMLGDLLLGADIDAVEEAVREREITKVPLAPPTMAGVLNLRGRILTVIDLRERLGLPPLENAPEPSSGPHLVVRTSTGSVSLIVDRFVGVIDVENPSGDASDLRDAAPKHLPQGLRDAVACIYRLEPQLLIELDLEHVCQPLEAATTKFSTKERH